MADWKTIDSAPLDGTSILVMRNNAPGLPGGVADKCWSGNTAVAEWWDDSGEEGEWVCYMHMVEEPRLHFDPTHWMPLPEPPGKEG